jgi:hypothetical protein
LKLYVCYGTWRRPSIYRQGHPCGNAYRALRAAGHDPEVIKSYGLGLLPDALNQTSGRKRVKELTGNSWVPALELDDGVVVDGSHAIVEWARANAANAAGATTGGASAAS